jgi:predicted translin family RNA/ssDNA-binding protein
MRHTLFDNRRATFLFHVCLVGKPFDTFAERVYVRILKYVVGHGDLDAHLRRQVVLEVQETRLSDLAQLWGFKQKKMENTRKLAREVGQLS